MTNSRHGGQGGRDELQQKGNGKKQPASSDFVFMVLGKLCIIPRHDTILISLSGMRTISATVCDLSLEQQDNFRITSISKYF